MTRVTLTWFAWAFLLLAELALAQAPRLSAEQQRVLNLLPPAQRQAALEQLRNLERTTQRNTTSDEAQPVPVDLPFVEPVAEPEYPVFAAGDTLILQLEVQENGVGDEQVEEELRELEDLLEGGNPYLLDRLGRAEMPRIGSIGLAGLDEQQASLRLAAEPALSMFSVEVVRLPLAAVGVAALKPFGYELFEAGSAGLRPNVALPAAADYVVGPGDTFRVQLFGNRNIEYELRVESNGAVQFPEIGPIIVAGRTYASAQELVGEQVRQRLIGTQASVTLSELRALQVFVVGDVSRPGSYAVSPLSTITTALAAGGGVATNGSLRRVELKRSGRLIQRLDVYDVLLRGDSRADVRLLAGDVVFVPPVGTRATVAGEVNRPAIYEYKGAANIEDLIGLAGGLKPTALKTAVKIERFEPGQGLRVLQADQTLPSGRAIKVRDGDTIVIPMGMEQLEDSITVLGNVQQPGGYQWREGLRISDLLPSSRTLRNGSDLNYLLVRREVVPNAQLEALSVDLEAAWRTRGQTKDLLLKPRDTVYVFDLAVGRRHIIEPLLTELRLRSSRSQPTAEVRVGGQVNVVGQYPLETGMRVSDLIRAGGGLSESAYLAEAELTRYALMEGEERDTELIQVDLARIRAGDTSADIELRAFDYLNVKEIPRWRDQEFVSIRGQVAFPGRYPIYEGETLTSVLDRAGGLTPLAFPRGSVFTRVALKDRERQQLDSLARRLESDLAAMAINNANDGEAAGQGENLLRQLRATDPVGRLVIDLEAVLVNRSQDIALRDGDVLSIPLAIQEVTVLGEVQYATSHLYDSRLDRADYLERSGGLTSKADARRTYVVRANGEVVVGSASRFFSRAKGFDIQPGDTIVVPLDTDRVKPLVVWASATQILYNLAIAAAAVNSF